MRRWFTVVALLGAGCAHAHDAEVVATYEPRATIGQSFTADMTRLLPDVKSQTEEAGVKALVTLLDDYLAAVGTLRPDKVSGERIDLVADLPAPGWALRVRVVPKPELMSMVTIEPIATQPNEHPVETAPWSVQDAFANLRRHVPTLLPARVPPMDPARFARLRAEATEAASAGHDPLLTPSEYVRVPRPITSEGVERPYFVPPSDPSTVKPDQPQQ